MFPAFVTAGWLSRFGVNGVLFVFTPGAMMGATVAIGTPGPETRDVALDEMSR
jgi:putative MFS transporter